MADLNKKILELQNHNKTYENQLKISLEKEMKRVKSVYETKFTDHKRQTDQQTFNQQNEIVELNKIIQQQMTSLEERHDEINQLIFKSEKHKVHRSAKIFEQWDKQKETEIAEAIGKSN